MNRLNTETGFYPRPSRKSTPSRKSLLGIRQLIILGFIVLSILLIAIIFFGFKMKNATTGLHDVNAVRSKISRHYLLPEDETPALATVTDKSKLTSTFIKKAENGDKILIYQVNKQAILYRPSIDRVVDVSPVIIDTPQNNTP